MKVDGLPKLGWEARFQLGSVTFHRVGPGWCGYRSQTSQMGFTREDYSGKPVIGIVDTWSAINHCHFHFKQRVEEVKRGVWQARGFPLELPAMSL